MLSNAFTCPLCGNTTWPWHTDRVRSYYRCGTCTLVSVPPAWHLDPAAEKAHYDLHENDPADPAYRRFLSRAADTVTNRVPPPAHGLDFGAGPGPALPVMLAEQGYRIDIFDPFYAPDETPLTRQYDFITSTEVFEHLRQPGREFERLHACLVAGGWLVVMTKRVRDVTSFADWHYTRDPTHVSFFSEQTFAWIASRYGMDLEIAGPDVVALRRHKAA